jgi:hypothetical protein
MAEPGSSEPPSQLITADMAAIRSQSIGWVCPEIRPDLRGIDLGRADLKGGHSSARID